MIVAFSKVNVLRKENIVILFTDETKAKDDAQSTLVTSETGLSVYFFTLQKGAIYIDISSWEGRVAECILTSVLGRGGAGKGMYIDIDFREGRGGECILISLLGRGGEGMYIDITFREGRGGECILNHI